MTVDPAASPNEHLISIVVPVYQGEKTLDKLLEEIEPLTRGLQTPMGNRLCVTEVVLVHDGGPDHSDVVIRRLASEFSFVHPVWLSRNFGQHAATIAGMASTGAEWIVTLDEDGQFDPHDIPRLLDMSLEQRAPLVYGIPLDRPPHGPLRNFASNAAKLIATRVLSEGSVRQFSSFRLMLGEIGRGIAAYIGPGVYLDVALSWAFARSEYCFVQFRADNRRPSGYSLRKLFSHFWHLVISVGPRPLRIVSSMGVAASIAGVVLAIGLLIEKFTNSITVPGWTSLAVILLVLGGLNLLALGVVAEYVGAAVRMAMGKPTYMIVSDLECSPLARRRGLPPDPSGLSE